jgi:hypothetical protein
MTVLDHSYNYLPILAIRVHEFVGRVDFLGDDGLGQFGLLRLIDAKFLFLQQ